MAKMINIEESRDEDRKPESRRGKDAMLAKVNLYNMDNDVILLCLSKHNT